MKELFRKAAIVLATTSLSLIFVTPSLAQGQAGTQISPAGTMPSQAIYCDDGTGHAALCGTPTANPITSQQQTVTTSAAALPNQAYPNGFVIRALQSNAGVIYYGGSGVTTSTGTPLYAGDSVSIPATNSNLAYVVGDTAGDKISISGN